MKIALVCSDRGPCPPVRGGAIQLLIAKIAPLLAEKHEVTVFSITDPKLPVRETKDRVTYIRFPQAQYIEQVCHYLKQHPVDIIQLYNRPTWIKKLRKVVPKAKIVLSLHNRIKSKDKPGIKGQLRQADKILTVSKFIIRDTITSCKVSSLKKKFKVMYTGADQTEYAPVWTKLGKQWRSEIRKKHGIGEQDAVVLFVGRLVSYKGCHILLEALKKKLNVGKKVTLLVVGSKWYADNEKDEYIMNLELMAKQSRNKVIFTSYIPVEEIPKYFVAADLFVNASQWKEPLARVHYEAMAAGLPIITTDRGGNREVIRPGKTGIIIKEEERKNHKQFRKAIKSILANPDKAKKMGKKGRKLVERIYNFERVAKDLIDLYTKLIAA